LALALRLMRRRLVVASLCPRALAMLVVPLIFSRVLAPLARVAL
jgi:hypothetical protein